VAPPTQIDGRHTGGDRRLADLGRYQLIGRLATGGMAEVYLALSGELSGFRTLVVVKRILPHLASNAQFISMFLDEARIAALLDHPNVVRIIEVGHDDDVYFLVMELVQGKPLSAVLRKAISEKSPLTHAQAAFIVAQAANGLNYAHNLVDSDGRPLNIVHRDVSPQNILISFEGAVKVIDFGIARALGRVTQTSPGGLKGKIQYMSPEQASAEDVDPRSDVFTLGVVLWEVLVGRRLFHRETELATMRAIVDEPIPFPSESVRVPPALEAIVMRALNKDPQQRFQTAQEMALALERFAFASESFSPLQIATYMKGLFAADFMQWKKTVSSAMEMEAPAGRRTGTFSTGEFLLAPPSADLGTRGPTVALRGSHSDAIPNHRVIPESSNDSRLLPAAEYVVQPSTPSAHDRLWVYGGVAALAMISIAGFLVVFGPRSRSAAMSAPPPAATATAEPAAPSPGPDPRGAAALAERATAEPQPPAAIATERTPAETTREGSSPAEGPRPAAEPARAVAAATAAAEKTAARDERPRSTGGTKYSAARAQRAAARGGARLSSVKAARPAARQKTPRPPEAAPPKIDEKPSDHRPNPFD
jgi:serine/threonine protein kinase